MRSNFITLVITLAAPAHSLTELLSLSLSPPLSLSLSVSLVLLISLSLIFGCLF